MSAARPALPARSRTCGLAVAALIAWPLLGSAAGVAAAGAGPAGLQAGQAVSGRERLAAIEARVLRAPADRRGWTPCGGTDHPALHDHAGCPAPDLARQALAPRPAHPAAAAGLVSDGPVSVLRDAAVR